MLEKLDDSNICYLIAGKGENRKQLIELIDNLGLTDRVKLLGYKTDIGDLSNTAGIFYFPSCREGLFGVA